MNVIVSNVTGYKVAQKIYSKLNNKESASQINMWIESEEGLNQDSLNLTFSEEMMQILSDTVKADVIVTCLLQAGAKSFTHLVTHLERYDELFVKVTFFINCVLKISM